jgi:hypothetical protein
MWLAIISIFDKLLSLAVSWLPWQLKRSDASKAKRDLEQALMDKAAKEGDYDAWKEAHYRRNRA